MRIFAITTRGRGEFGMTGSGLRMFNSLHAMWRLLTVAVREIFDENAYERFLIRQHACRSAQSYREFLRERESAGAKPRCC
jgi:hypothetical protein